MLKYSKADYELVIRSQSEIETNIKDSRLTIEIGNPDNREDMYSGLMLWCFLDVMLVFVCL
jgi:hypothetical protein